LLACLPLETYERLLPDLEPVSLRPKRELFKPGVLTNKVYFPGSGVCSISATTADGRATGIALIGNEGLVGMSEFGADPESGETATVEIVDGSAQMMDLNVFRREMAAGSAFHDVVCRYANAFIASLMRSVVCNAVHSIGQRYARCLLEIKDRIGGTELPLTQGTLARMLGVRRASIAVASGELRRAEIIDHGHHLVIHDPYRLEGVACDCYAVIKKHFAASSLDSRVIS
jgi:CRP-like cAMP-binding protein